MGVLDALIAAIDELAVTDPRRLAGRDTVVELHRQLAATDRAGLVVDGEAPGGVGGRSAVDIGSELADEEVVLARVPGGAEHGSHLRGAVEIFIAEIEPLQSLADLLNERRDQVTLLKSQSEQRQDKRLQMEEKQQTIQEKQNELKQALSKLNRAERAIRTPQRANTGSVDKDMDCCTVRLEKA